MKGEMLTFVLKSGRIQKLTGPSTISTEALNHWKDILARWQVILSDDGADVKWSRTEADTTGTYLASYSRIAPARPFEIWKRKDHYVNLKASSQAAFATANSVDGGAMINLRPYQTLIEGREHLVISNLGVDSEVLFSFRLKNASRDDSIDQAVGLAKVALLNSIPTSLSWAGEVVANSRVTQGNARNSADIRTELALLKKLLAEGKAGTVEEVNALDRIVNLVKEDDFAIDPIFDELGSKSVSTDMASALIGILGAAGTPASQTALLSMATAGEWPHSQREMALFSFVQVTAPILEVESWLQRLYERQDSLANNALLVLAAMGDRLRDINPDRFSSISQFVLEAAKMNGLPLDEKIFLLNAIGNLGPQEVPALVQSTLKGDDPLLRQQALQSLQRIQSDTAYDLIMDSIKNDPVNSVRAAAVKVLSETSWESAPATLMQLATTDGSGQVRREALTGLSQWVDTNPKIRATFERVAQHDPSREIRNLAAQLLASSAHGKQL